MGNTFYCSSSQRVAIPMRAELFILISCRTMAWNAKAWTGCVVCICDKTLEYSAESDFCFSQTWWRYSVGCLQSSPSLYVCVMISFYKDSSDIVIRSALRASVELSQLLTIIIFNYYKDYYLQVVTIFDTRLKNFSKRSERDIPLPSNCSFTTIATLSNHGNIFSCVYSA